MDAIKIQSNIGTLVHTFICPTENRTYISTTVK